jgi:hypothetical protein
MGNQQSGSGGSGDKSDKNKDKEKKRYEPPVPTRVGKKRKHAKVIFREKFGLPKPVILLLYTKVFYPFHVL